MVTVELFDSPATIEAPQAGPGTAALPLMLPLFPEPVAMTVTAREVSLPAAGGSQKAETRDPAPSVAPPPAPVPEAPFDSGFDTPIRPRARPAFPFAEPIAPPAGQPQKATSSATAAARQQSPQPVKRAEAAAAGAAATAGSATAGTAKTAASATAGTAAAAGSTAAAAAGSTTSSSSGEGGAGSAAPGDSYGRLREIYARQGDEVQIGLDGLGYLFLGFPDRSPQADGMSFKAKQNRNNKTWFTFQALKLGTYDLDFLLQQNTTGQSSKETVRVHVVSDSDFASAVNQQPEQGQTGSASGETGDPVFAERLTSLGQYEAAIAELLKGYKDGNPGLNDQIASLYMRTGAYDAAAKYYTKNLTPPGPYATRAVLGLVRVSVAQKDQQSLMTYLKQFLAVSDPQAEEPLIQAVRMERDKSEIGVGLDLAGEYAARFPSGTWIDEAQFLRAQFLEADSPFRDIARSRDTYRDLLKEHPESTFADAARERLRYIERHFFQVR